MKICNFSDVAQVIIIPSKAITTYTMQDTNDQESFHLLQISDSASDSLPDLDLVSHNTNFKKKKVRLKR